MTNIPSNALRDEEQNKFTVNLRQDMKIKDELSALLELPENEQNKLAMDETLIQLKLLEPANAEWAAKSWPEKLAAIREIQETVGQVIHLAVPAAVTALTVGTGKSAKAVVEGTEAKETPVELTAVIEKMEATAEKHSNFGFGTAEALATFLETLPQKLSPDSLATLRALKPRETEESYTVFFKEGTQIYLGESAPSSKGPNGKEGNGVKIAATNAAKESYKTAPKDYYSETGSAEALFAQLKKSGAKDLTRASKAMLKTLQGLKLFSGAVPSEWLSDRAASGRAWYGCAEADYAAEHGADDAAEYWGVRALRNVSKELGA